MVPAGSGRFLPDLRPNAVGSGRFRPDLWPDPADSGRISGRIHPVPTGSGRFRPELSVKTEPKIEPKTEPNRIPWFFTKPNRKPKLKIPFRTSLLWSLYGA